MPHISEQKSPKDTRTLIVWSIWLGVLSLFAIAIYYSPAKDWIIESLYEQSSNSSSTQYVTIFPKNDTDITVRPDRWTKIVPQKGFKVHLSLNGCILIKFGLRYEYYQDCPNLKQSFGRNMSDHIFVKSDEDGPVVVSIKYERI